MIEAAIFDMDGLLLDSEPFWQESEIAVFRSVGVPMTVEMCLQMTGVRVGEVIPYWYARFPWTGKSFAALEEEILAGVEQRVRDRGTPSDGALAVFELLQRRGVRLALASSSAPRLIRAVLEKLRLKEVFEVVHSAEQEEYGKPHPAVFLTTARRLNVEPSRCLVFEDSFAGVVAAKAARMKTVAVPMPAQFDDARFAIADLRLRSLAQFGETEWHAVNNP